MIDGELMDEIRESAAQGKTSLHDVCKRCKGHGRILSWSFDFKKCPKCQGTGKEKAK